jgi:hypothetical protein
VVDGWQERSLVMLAIAMLFVALVAFAAMAAFVKLCDRV